MPAYFSRQAFSIYRSAFERVGNAMPFDVARLFLDLSVRALETCGRLAESVSLAANRSATSSGEDDERIAHFSRMLERVETLAASEGAGHFELRHLLQASFDELGEAPPSILTAESVAKVCADLRELDYEPSDSILRIEVRYDVICTGTEIVDFGNDYETFPDAVRAMRHVQQRAGLRSRAERTDYRTTYVAILMPTNAEAVSKVVIRARDAVT